MGQGAGKGGKGDGTAPMNKTAGSVGGEKDMKRERHKTAGGAAVRQAKVKGM